MKERRMNMKRRYYVAYGSNLNKEQMAWRCPGAKPLGIANLVGYELKFKGSQTGAYLTIEENKDSLVPVAIWAVTAKDEATLDRYEGFPKFYYKKKVILPLNGDAVECFVYIMHEDRPLGVPSPWYVETCRMGYEDFGLDTYYLDKAVLKSEEGIYEEVS